VDAASATFTATQPVRFADCDPAGIVFFPRFLEMVNGLTEDWFESGLATPFNHFHLHEGYGVPVVNTRVDFRRACRLGERIDFELGVETLGSSSAVLAVCGRVGGEERLRLRHKVAVVSLELRRAVAMPAELRERMSRFVVPGAKPTPDPVPHDGRVPANAFRARHLVRFSHCDPAGVVFYPRFFDLFSSTLEDWFQQGIDCPFGGEFMGRRNLRVPSLSIAAEFLRACRMGEFLDLDLWVARLGRSSIDLALEGSVAGEPRLRAAWKICVIDYTNFKSTPIPDDLRERMQRFAAAGA
jgi:4-hydroxybenzoyl-CoA thioesterase